MRRNAIEAAPRGMPAGRVAALADALLVPRPARLRLLLACGIGLLVCSSLFGRGFLLGSSAFWDNPRGLMPGSWADMTTALAGYTAFVQAPWGWPLFHVTTLGTPDGASIVFTDSVPLLALLGRLAFALTGRVWNPFGLWTAGCFLGAAMAMAGLAAALGQRGLAAAAAAALFGAGMPVLLARMGHLALLAQFEIVLALTLCLGGRDRPWRGRDDARAALLCVLALWTQAYLFAMVAALVLAALAQAMLDRRLSGAAGCRRLAGLAGLLGGLAWVSGYLAGGGAAGAWGFGVFSLNLLAPFVPGVLADATGGQYEGFAYFGLGVLLLAALALRGGLPGWRAHACLIAVLLAMLVFAVSDQICAGPVRLFSVPLPGFVRAAAQIFRSSGRFVWPAVYLATGLAVAGTLAAWGRAGVVLVLAAALLQWGETAPLRQALAAQAAGATPLPLPPAALAAAAAGARQLLVLPSFACLPPDDIAGRAVAMQVELLAARQGVPTNTVYAARGRSDCAAEGAGPVSDADLLLILPGFRLPPGLAGLQCRTGTRLTACSGRPGAAAALERLTGT